LVSNTYPTRKESKRQLNKRKEAESVHLHHESQGRKIGKLYQPGDMQQKGTKHWNEIR